MNPIADSVIRSDLYQKPTMHNTLAYFPPLQEHYSNGRLAAFQHQLHISTSTPSHLESSNTTWPNLIIPYQPATPLGFTCNLDADKDIDIVSQDEDHVRITGEEEEESGKVVPKKKNPYSIEELLKKPSKKLKSSGAVACFVQQPFGSVVDNSDGVIFDENSGDV